MQDSEPSAQSGDPQRYCPRCATVYPPKYTNDADVGTTLDDDGELIPDRDWSDLNLERWRWVETSDGLVCPNCASTAECWAQEGHCIRCGSEENEEEAWWARGVCHRCATRQEEREGVLSFLRLTAEAIAWTRSSRDFDRAARLNQPESWTTTVEIMLQRGVPNHLHYVDPIDPLADQHESQPACWDIVSKETQAGILQCNDALFKARFGLPDVIPAEGHPIGEEAPDWWLGVDWWALERTIRNYVHEAERAAVGSGRS